ncbi:MAG: carboxymuconolactone decarboxylase family protein [Anaerolineae bacterium]|nr:carboxymuconolactone decarboxylase family protein [Anaerolineae bacterium]
MRSFSKRFYTPRTFLRDLRQIAAHMGDFRQAARSGRVSRTFAEKIMLAVTAVNGCRYCAYGHSRWALEAGVEPGEIERLLASELGEFPEEEAVALAFAQHWAETGGEPDPEAERRFRDYYGERVSDDILNWMRMIQMGNLMGNTFDAILWRLGLGRSNTSGRGNRAPTREG